MSPGLMCTHHAACSDAAMISCGSPIFSSKQNDGCCCRVGACLFYAVLESLRLKLDAHAFCGCVEDVSGVRSHFQKLTTAKVKGRDGKGWHGMAWHDVAGGSKPRHELVPHVESRRAAAAGP